MGFPMESCNIGGISLVRIACMFVGWSWFGLFAKTLLALTFTLICLRMFL